MTAPDASDEVAANNRRGDQARHVRADRNVIRAIMGTVEGRSFMWRFLHDCHIFEDCFAPGAADVTAHRLGERNVGVKMLAQVTEAAPERYLDAMREAREDAERIVKTEEARVAKDEEERAAPAVQFPDVPAPEGFDA